MQFNLALYPINANGNSYNEADMTNFGYVTNLPAALNDTLAHIALLFCSTTSTSITIPGTVGGTFTFTTGAGLGYQAGSMVQLTGTASPLTQWMTLEISSYNKTTGVMQAVCTNFKGSGTLTSWDVTPLGYDRRNGTVPFVAGSYGLTPAVLGTDQGSLGKGAGFSGGISIYDNQRQTAWLGLESPKNAMVEIFDNFFSYPAGFPELGVSGSGTSAAGYIGLPWHYSAIYAGFTGLSVTTTALSAPRMCIGIGSVLSYGNNGGWMHIGKGAVTYETGVSFTGNFGATYARTLAFGLSACGAANPSKDIFSNGGIGFFINSSSQLECWAGVAGSVQKVITSIQYSVAFQYSSRYRIEIDHTGTTAAFYVSDVLVATITGNIGGQGINNLLLPTYEAQNLTVPTFRGLLNASVEYFYLAKYLMR